MTFNNQQNVKEVIIYHILPRDYLLFFLLSDKGLSRCQGSLEWIHC